MRVGAALFGGHWPPHERLHHYRIYGDYEETSFFASSIAVTPKARIVVAFVTSSLHARSVDHLPAPIANFVIGHYVTARPEKVWSP